MMRVNRLTDYATLIICEMINSNNQKIVSAKYLSEKTRISKTTVMKILKMLIKAKLLKSHRGHTGGYQLAKQLSDITILNIITAIEGDIALTLCGTKKHNICQYNTGCKVKHGWNKLNQLFIQALKDFTIQDLINDNTNFELKKIN
ncbi:MAG: SUF system Fe-S cluster assembly regulator [Rickettsiales bacterium]|nr:SUF system Fe-S cluster assembly regulator [Rickettsiales bacterium]